MKNFFSTACVTIKMNKKWNKYYESRIKVNCCVIGDQLKRRWSIVMKRTLVPLRLNDPVEAVNPAGKLEGECFTITTIAKLYTQTPTDTYTLYLDTTLRDNFELSSTANVRDVACMQYSIA